ncbi:MAG: ribose-phosphate diphosphokinase [Candidatus Kariarchaeaceae archaeon]|jgi:ribose-phosphate pyrophosphokinase
MQIIPGQTGIEFAEELAQGLDWPLLIPEFKSFSDGEQSLRLPTIPEDNVLIIQSLYFPQDSNLFQLLNLVSTAKRLGSSKITVFTPYLCYARSDRDIIGGEAISSSTVLQLMEAVGINHLITLDIHNPSIFSSLRKMEATNVYPSKSMANYLKKHVENPSELQIIAPDLGAIKRAERLAEELGVSHTFLSKSRDPKKGTVNVELGNANVESKRIVLVDDIISTGTSLLQSASLLTLFDIAEIHVLITHALGTNAIDRLFDIGSGIIAATKSIPSVIAKISPLEDLLDVLI